MFNFKTIRCNTCSSVIFNLPASEIENLYGRTLLCECCNNYNVFTISGITRTFIKDSLHAIV